ncbi:hypothetical protein F3157_14720 [Virgibacillus dakarensis]|uniref:Integral membrane protein n=1 Tax=Lentibacillus populi TaxID=1827502 RepID=A0A9W5X6G3_9BACI|nr:MULTISPECIES: hypothetical protein [Bacillaceae]MBT2217033.1 hypothetical protein [Virgibacillus dakarensis]MTW86903.1 hypothetical protein [Virgibacillus dakarensis]GGB52362.1 hypothetical protein GCM10011409_32400 [Lentibacillus populi]
MVDLILSYQWELFIAIEVLSFASLLLFGIVRYLFDKRNVSLLFLFCFVALLVLEAILAVFIYGETGEISKFQIIITVFVVYACTFGIFDFMKLDRWMRKVIGGWRNVQLLSAKDIEIMNRQKDPQYMAKKYRWSSIAHLIVFVGFQIAFWIYGTGGAAQSLEYIKDLSWIGTENVMETPYANETIYGISMVWGIAFIADFIYSWSYTIFPSNSKG